MEKKPDGLSYHHDIISDDLYSSLLEYLESVSSEFFPVGSGKNSRLVLHRGHTYNYKKKGVDGSAPSFEPILHELVALSGLEGFNQCIINRYLPGQGINPHTDSSDYGDTIICFTIGGSAEMEFTLDDHCYKLLVEPRSMYVMSGDSRYAWKHGMRSRKSDSGTPRSTRYSFTFRKVNLLK